MSVIDKKPFIVKVLEKLTASQTVLLKNLINGEDSTPIYRSLVPGSPALLKETDKGIKAVKLEVAHDGTVSQALYTGFLIYIDYTENHNDKTLCVLISYSGKSNQTLTLIDIDTKRTPYSYAIRGCELSITELRSELDDTKESESVEIIEVVNEAIADGTIVIPTVNVLTFENVEFNNLISDKTSAWIASLSITEEDYDKLSNPDEECVVRLISNSDTIDLRRIVIETNRVRFAAQYSNTSDIADYSAIFTHVGSTYSGTAIESTMLEANVAPAGDPELAELALITVNGETYEIPKGMRVLELNNASGTLSDADYNIAASDACILKYDEALYFKGEDNAVYITYNVVAFANAGIYGDRIVITKSTKGYEHSDNNYIVNPTFNGTENNLLGFEYGNGQYKVNYANLAPAYNASSTYAVGDLCTKDGNLYSCNTAILVAEAWNSSHWTLTDIASAILGMINVGY